MPLKHGHETRLIFQLGILFVLAGVILSLLPALPVGIAPWAIAFIIAVAYPVILHPTLKRNRADTSFRKLHWLPAFLLLVWLILQGVLLVLPVIAPVLDWFSWAWSIIAITVGFFLLVLFCLKVIRQRARRILILALIFVLYATAGLLSEQPQFTFNQSLTALLWDNPIWESFGMQGTGDLVAQENGSSSSISSDTRNLAPSSDPSEERWREALRAFQRRMQDVVSFGDTGTGITSSSASTNTLIGERVNPSIPKLPPSLQNGGTGAHIREVESKPNGLPNSGFGLGAFALTLIGGYCATIHARARRRVIIS